MQNCTTPIVKLASLKNAQKRPKRVKNVIFPGGWVFSGSKNAKKILTNAHKIWVNHLVKFLSLCFNIEVGVTGSIGTFMGKNDPPPLV